MLNDKLPKGLPAGDGHRPVDGGRIPSRRLLGHWRPTAVRGVRSPQPEAHREGVGGIVSRATHHEARNGALNGGPQMVEISHDGKRV
jgi:hypothetical protein